ncbi:MAG: response regulator [bacterium]
MKKILVVDDSRTMRRLIKNELTHGGYEVVEAENGVQALEVVLTTPIDLITLDVDMPKLNGYETCQALRSDKYTHIFRKGRYNRIPIVMVTALDTMEDRQKGFEVGASDFLTKPFNDGDLVAVANKILQPQNKLKGLTALVVEDSLPIREIIMSCLIEQGINVLEANNGKQGFEIVKSEMKKIDMLITDLTMPQMNGDELCKKVRNELGLKDLAIIFLTATEEKDSLLDLFKIGATHYIIKPFIKEELISSLNVHLEVRLLNKNLQEKAEKLDELSKLRDDFLTICSHDLKSPANNILNFSGLLLDEDYINDNDKKSLQHIKTSAEVLLTLINDLIDINHSQTNEKDFTVTPISLGKIAQSSINTLSHVAKTKNIKLELENKIINDDDDIIFGNTSFLVRAIDNLISNAIKFTFNENLIKVLIEPHQDTHIAVSVIDKGMGIPEENIKYLFTNEPGFYRGEDGMGTGLTIVKQVVEKHGGTLEITSEVGKGSCFKLLFPKIKDRSLNL